MRIVPRTYIKYKALNSLFTGLSLGSVFSIYESLSPSIFSLGGIVLAVGMLIVAKFYDVLISVRRYFYIVTFVEAVMLATITLFLISPFNYTSALLVYCGYQLTFLFGSYIFRAETLLLRKKRLLSMLDMAKQAGYLIGLAAAYAIYESLSFFGVTDVKEQVYLMHFLFFIIEVGVLYLIFFSFKGRK